MVGEGGNLEEMVCLGQLGGGEVYLSSERALKITRAPE